MTETEITGILNLVQNVGMWVVFLWLYANEKKSHQHTREQYREDLREIANLRQNIGRVQSYVRESKQVPANGEMKPLS